MVKGQTASSSYKPAKLANGARIMVPPHIGTGTRVPANTGVPSMMEASLTITALQMVLDYASTQSLAEALGPSDATVQHPCHQHHPLARTGASVAPATRSPHAVSAFL